MPATHDENELRAAVGASPVPSSKRAASRDDGDARRGEGDQRTELTRRDDRDDSDDRDDELRHRRPPRTALIAALFAVGAAGVAAVVLFGYLNSDRYVLACEPERAVPEQGRGFPPWGTRALGGEPWRPLKIAPETRCRPQETDDVLVLQRAYLAMVLDQATGLLTAREVTRLDDADALLKQALLLTRPAEHEPEPLAKQRSDQHQEIERLLGDVAYWRGQAKVRDAIGALGDAARQFDAAVAQHPRHVSDATAWAARVRQLAQELHAGSATATATAPPGSAATPPGSATPPPPPAASGGPSEHPGVPTGIELPVEPGRAAATPPAPPAPAPPAPAPPAPAPTAPPPDAGTPTGGVLL